ncbi:hypothetical protein GF336_00285 [Candidatus Woesearchaeota archaeon]|nr:hypothetical protein [Candidatus Woesearchaeota archaeon]
MTKRYYILVWSYSSIDRIDELDVNSDKSLAYEEFDEYKHNMENGIVLTPEELMGLKKMIENTTII